MKNRGGRGPSPEQQLCYGSGDFAIAQQLVYYAVAVSTAVRSRVTRTISVAQLLTNNWSKRQVQLSEPSSATLILISHGLSWESSTISLLLISLGPRKWKSDFFVRVQLTSRLLHSMLTNRESIKKSEYTTIFLMTWKGSSLWALYFLPQWNSYDRS